MVRASVVFPMMFSPFLSVCIQDTGWILRGNKEKIKIF